MPGTNHYTEKEKRQIRHIIDSEKDAGHSQDDAERIGYATVNKERQEHKKKRSTK